VLLPQCLHCVSCSALLPSAPCLRDYSDMQLLFDPTHAASRRADYEMLRFHPCAVGFGCVDLACAARGFDAAPLSTGLRGSGIDVQVRASSLCLQCCSVFCLRSAVWFRCDPRACGSASEWPGVGGQSVHPPRRAPWRTPWMRARRRPFFACELATCVPSYAHPNAGLAPAALQRTLPATRDTAVAEPAPHRSPMPVLTRPLRCRWTMT
jgi:hypothetical protein